MIGFYLFYFKKSWLNQKTHPCNWKTGLIGQANGSKVVYLSAGPYAVPSKANFCLYVEY